MGKKRFRLLLAFLLSMMIAWPGLVNSYASEPAKPVITNVEVEIQNGSGYRVTVSFYAPKGVKEVLMPTWTDHNGQDDLIWHKAQISGNTASFFVPVSAHGGEFGAYTTHIYVYGKDGQFDLRGVWPTLPEAVAVKPVIAGTDITEVSAEGYRVTVTFHSLIAVREVLMPTWTERNGQDDLIWHKAQISGSTATFYVPVSSHKGESGAYLTHIYVYDQNGQYALTGEQITVPPAAGTSAASAKPTITGTEITEVSSGGYRVTAFFSAPVGVREVLMPTWTDYNGQDDLIWYKAQINGNTATCYVSAASHRGESGAYTTHIYLYDQKGQQDLKGEWVTVPQAALPSKPVITGTNVTEQSSGGYRVTVTFDAPAGAKEVLMPTWTEQNGQDDLIWHRAQIDGNTASFYVSAAEHKGENGNYITHVYLYDKAGLRADLVGVNVTIQGSQLPAGQHVVCLDAGHQQAGISELEPNGPGSSTMKAKLTTGTVGCVTGLAEHQLNLTIALGLKQELINRGYQVIMIRETADCPMSNAERAQMANNSGAEIFVRIHANGSADSSVSGALFYAPSSANPYLNSSVINGSNTLSRVMLNAFCAATGAVNRGLIQDDTMTGINWCSIPVTIAEMGFMSNPTEDRLMADPAYQAKMIQGLANGIDAYFGY